MKTSVMIATLLTALTLFVLAQPQGPGDAQLPNTKPGNRTNDGMPGVTGQFNHAAPADTTGKKGSSGNTGNTGTHGTTGPTGKFAPMGSR